jgi:hypothetical protein
MQQQKSKSRRDLRGNARVAGVDAAEVGYMSGAMHGKEGSINPGAGWLVAPEGGELQQPGAVAWGRLHSQAVTAVAAAGYVVLTTSLDGYLKVRALSRSTKVWMVHVQSQTAALVIVMFRTDSMQY